MPAVAAPPAAGHAGAATRMRHGPDALAAGQALTRRVTSCDMARQVQAGGA